MAIDEYIDFENEIEEKESKSISNEVRKPTGKSFSFFAHPIKATAAAVMAAYITVIGAGAVGPSNAHAGEAYAANSQEYNSQGWAVPNLSRAKKVKDFYFDRKNDPNGKRTRIEMYDLRNGSRIFKLSVNGNTFGYGIDKDKKAPVEYEILDMDGDGKFETKMYAGSKYTTPKWVRQDRKYARK